MRMRKNPKEARLSLSHPSERLSPRVINHTQCSSLHIPFPFLNARLSRLTSFYSSANTTAMRTCVVFCTKIIMYFIGNMVSRCKIAILCKVWSRVKGGREILSLLRSSDSPRHPRRDKKSKTRDEEKRRMLWLVNLFSPFHGYNESTPRIKTDIMRKRTVERQQQLSGAHT